MKLRLLICVLLFFPAVALGQNQLTVTATNIHGPNGVPYAFGTAHASTNCTGNAQAYIGTTPIPRDTPTVGLDGFAGFSQVLYNTALMVDVNQNPLVCNYIYHVIDQCGIAAFAASVTGVTGAGPVDLSTQINAVAVNVSPQCSQGGGGVFAIYQHNGTLVGQQPIYNFLDSGSVTASFVNDVANNRVNLQLTSVGGTGCTLPGLDTGVLSEHPANHCYNSANWTWDDGSNRQVMQAGKSNTVSANVNDGFIFGQLNSTTANPFQISQTRVFGDHNTVGPDGTNQENHIFGDNNTQDNVVENFMIGTQNFHQDNASDLFDIGKGNQVFSNTPGTSVNISDCFIQGENNFVKSDTGPQTIINCSVFGFGNTLSEHLGNGGSGVLQNVAVVGENNSITSTNGVLGTISDVHILGENNTVEDILNDVAEVEIVGENNLINGASSTAQILGLDNTGNNVTPPPTGDTTMVGWGNTISNAPANNNTFAMTVGSHLTESACSDCFLFGRSGSTSTSNFIGIGLSTTPELQITPSAVNVAAWPVSKVIAFTYCASGCTLTGTPCTTGSASYNTCTDSINFSTLGTFADTAYIATCGGVGPVDPGNPSNVGRVILQGVVSKATGSVSVNTATEGSSAVHWTEIDCTLVHR